MSEMVAELLITTDMKTCFKSCIGQKNYKHFFDKYKRTLCKDLDNLSIVLLGNETSMVIAQNIKNLIKYLENFNPQYPGSIVKGAIAFGNVSEQIQEDMKDAILRMNWDSFYGKYIPYIDDIIDKAREQTIIFVRVEHENNWYPNFSSRGNKNHILQVTYPERGHPLKSKNSGEMLKFKPARPHYSLNISSPKSANIENGTNDFSRNSSVTNKTTLFSKINNNGAENISDNGVGNLSSDNSRYSTSTVPIEDPANFLNNNSPSLDCWNAQTELSSANPNSHNEQKQLIRSANTNGLEDRRSIVTGQDTSKFLISNGETSTEKEIHENNYRIQASEHYTRPVEEVVDSSIVHESAVPSEKQFRASSGSPIERNYEFGTNRQIQTVPGTNYEARNVPITDGTGDFDTFRTIPVQSPPKDYSKMSFSTTQNNTPQSVTLSEDAKQNQTTNFQSLSHYEMPYSLQESFPAPKEVDAWADKALNSLRPPTPDEQSSLQEEKYDNEFYTYSADMSCLNHQADEMVEKGKNTGEELRAQEGNQFYAPLDPNISLESEEDNTSFNEHLEQVKAKQREELEEKRRERRKRQAELEEEMRKLRNESKERFRIFISCILLRIRFEEQEQHWMDWIASCRNHIVSLHRYFSIFEQEYHTVFGRKHQPDSEDLEEFQKERRRFHSFLIDVFNDLEDDFGKLNSVEGYSEVLFLRILQCCLANVATELLTIVNLVANLQTDKQSFTVLEETISKLKAEKIYSTSKLRELCKTSDAPEIYQNVTFPKLSSEPLIEETY